MSLESITRKPPLIKVYPDQPREQYRDSLLKRSRSELPLHHSNTLKVAEPKTSTLHRFSQLSFASPLPNLSSGHLKAPAYQQRSSFNSPASSRASPQYLGSPINTNLCRTPDENSLKVANSTTAKADEVYQEKLKASFAQPTFEPGCNTLTLRVVGRSISPKDLDLLKLVLDSLQESQNPSLTPILRDFIGITRRIRGTYFIEDPEQFRHFTVPVADILHAQFHNGQIEKTILGYCSHFIAVFKPADEARGMSNCRDVKKILGEIHPGQFGVAPEMDIPNQILAAGLYPHFGYTSMETTLESPAFYDAKAREGSLVTKTGSLQEFISDATPLEELTPQLYRAAIDGLPLDCVQEIFIFDLAFVNTDRNANNLLYHRQNNKMYPIDHAYLFPAQFKTASNLVWMDWDRAKEPFTEKSKQAIANQDFEKDMAKILSTYPGYPAENLEIMRLSYAFLKMAASMGATPFQIGCFYTGILASPLNNIYERAKEVTQDPQELHRITQDCLQILLKQTLANYSELSAMAKKDFEKKPHVSFNQHLQKNIGCVLNIFTRSYFQAFL